MKVLLVLPNVNQRDSIYGDLILALKTAQGVKEQYAKNGEGREVFLILPQDMIDNSAVLNVKNSQEFTIPFLTPPELEAKLQTSKSNIDVEAVIQAPVTSKEPCVLLPVIDKMLLKHYPDKKIMLFGVSEYVDGLMSDEEKTEFQDGIRSTRGRISLLPHDDLIITGIGESGILPNTILLEQKRTYEDHFEFVDKKISNILTKNNTISAREYREKAEISLQYSHDILDQFTEKPCTQFIKTHQEFVKKSLKNQDVVMIGNSPEEKLNALLSIREKLISNGYQNIIFYNMDVNEESKISTSEKGKTYRVLYSSGIPHDSMVALMGMSGLLVGATGDQSFSEAVSARKLFTYESRSHKADLIKVYDQWILEKSNSDPLVNELLQLLRQASTDEEYVRLGELLRDNELQSTMTFLNDAFLKEQNFNQNFFEVLQSQDKLKNLKFIPPNEDRNSPQFLEKCILFLEQLCIIVNKGLINVSSIYTFLDEYSDLVCILDLLKMDNELSENIYALDWIYELDMKKSRDYDNNHPDLLEEHITHLYNRNPEQAKNFYKVNKLQAEPKLTFEEYAQSLLAKGQHAHDKKWGLTIIEQGDNIQHKQYAKLLQKHGFSAESIVTKESRDTPEGFVDKNIKLL